MADHPAPPLRELALPDLDAAVAEARRLLDGGYVRRGSWSLGQICRHLTVSQRMTLEGAPWYLKAVVPLRPILRRKVLPRLLAGDFPTGVPAPGPFRPPAATDADDAAEVAAFAESVARCQACERFKPIPPFGRLSVADTLRFHTNHAAHHLRHLEPV